MGGQITDDLKCVKECFYGNSNNGKGSKKD